MRSSSNSRSNSNDLNQVAISQLSRLLFLALFRLQLSSHNTTRFCRVPLARSWMVTMVNAIIAKASNRK